MVLCLKARESKSSPGLLSRPFFIFAASSGAFVVADVLTRSCTLCTLPRCAHALLANRRIETQKPRAKRLFLSVYFESGALPKPLQKLGFASVLWLILLVVFRCAHAPR